MLLSHSVLYFFSDRICQARQPREFHRKRQEGELCVNRVKVGVDVLASFN